MNHANQIRSRTLFEKAQTIYYQKNLGRWSYFFLAVILGCFLLFPIFWMVKISFSPQGELFSMPPKWISDSINLEGYKAFWFRTTFLRFYVNSIIVALGTVIICLFAGILAAYSFSCFLYSGRNTLMLTTLSAQMFPWALLLISLYIFLGNLGLVNTYLGLILAHSIFALPLTIWIIKGYFDTVPKELMDAAIVDGCGPMQILVRIIIPVSYPGILAAGIYVFIFSWNDFIFGLTLTSQENMRTLGPGIAMTFIGEHAYAWVDMMASSILVSLPTVIVFLLLQRFFIEGLTSGAVKG